MQTMLWQKISSLEDEARMLKSLQKKMSVPKRAKHPLFGILKGIPFTEKEIDQAQRNVSLFK